MAEISGGAKLEAALTDLGKKYNSASSVKVGFLEDAKYPDGTPVAMIAAINNFGAPSKGIPPRPFFSNMVKAKSGEWAPALGKLLASGKSSFDALDELGQGIAGQLKQAIVDTSSPPNSPVTNLLKQRFPQGGQTFADVLQARRDVANGVVAPPGKPLEHTKIMFNSVDREVVK